jgi:serine/threonine protein phosphatase 1
MVLQLFRSNRIAAPKVLAGRIPDDERVYAIGDIHGRCDLLETLLALIEKDETDRPPLRTTLIFLGDLIDRGPDSAQVVERLETLRSSRPSMRFLLGNHEEVFLKALAGDIGALKFFVRMGGKETILSYGIDLQVYNDIACYQELLALVQASVPESHVRFLESFEDMIVVGDYVFVHAGIDPALPLESQRTSDLRWIRERFLDHDGTLDKIVVHGHSVTDQVELLPHRIGLDTGAFASDRLSALGLEGPERWILQT